MDTPHAQWLFTLRARRRCSDGMGAVHCPWAVHWECSNATQETSTLAGAQAAKEPARSTGSSSELQGVPTPYASNTAGFPVSTPLPCMGVTPFLNSSLEPLSLCASCVSNRADLPWSYEGPQRLRVLPWLGLRKGVRRSADGRGRSLPTYLELHSHRLTESQGKS